MMVESKPEKEKNLRTAFFGQWTKLPREPTDGDMELKDMI